VFQALAARLPGLRLAVPTSQLVTRLNVVSGGLVTVPVTWDGRTRTVRSRTRILQI
jgi:hypothetical protein